MKRKKEMSIDDYIKDAEINFSFPIILIIILLVVSFFTKFYLLLLLVCVILIIIAGQLNTRCNIYKIKKFLNDKDLIDKIGNVYFWNEENYMLTDYYFIIIVNNKVNAFKYEDIDKIYKKIFWGDKEVKVRHYFSKIPVYEYLYISLKSNKVYRVLIWSSHNQNARLMDISDYLISKNKNIKTKCGDD